MASTKNKKTKRSKQSSKTISRLLRWLRNPKRAAAAIFVVAFAGIGLYMLLGASAITPHQTYTNWNWSPPAEGFNSLKHQLTIDAVTPNAPYFWSHQFQFIGGDGGYIGLQSQGNRVNGSVGKTAIFSVFGAGLAATPGNCVVEQAGFDGYNTSGSSCRIPYEWVQGRAYRLRTVKQTADSSGTWWAGYVQDTSTGAETLIGQIKLPPSWKGHGAWSVMWTEYFGAKPATCADLPYSKVRFTKPWANAGTIRPVSTSNYLTETSECKSSTITNGVDEVTHQMGNQNLAGTPTPTPSPTRDTTLPTVIINSPPANGTYNSPLNISASASDNVKVASMQILINGSVVKTVSGGSISMSWTAPNKGNKIRRYTLMARAKDTSGNVRDKQITVYMRN